jgi:hypothetical protein
MTMLNRKNVVLTAIAVMVLSLGAAAILTMISEVTYGAPERVPPGLGNACMKSGNKPPFCGGVGPGR